MQADDSIRMVINNNMVYLNTFWSIYGIVWYTVCPILQPVLPIKRTTFEDIKLNGDKQRSTKYNV